MRCLELDNKAQSVAFIEAVTVWLTATAGNTEAAMPQSTQANPFMLVAGRSDIELRLTENELVCLSTMLGILRSGDGLTLGMFKGAMNGAKEKLDAIPACASSRVHPSDNDLSWAPE